MFLGNHLKEVGTEPAQTCSIQCQLMLAATPHNRSQYLKTSHMPNNRLPTTNVSNKFLSNYPTKTIKTSKDMRSIGNSFPWKLVRTTWLLEIFYPFELPKHQRPKTIYRSNKRKMSNVKLQEEYMRTVPKIVSEFHGRSP